MWAAPHLSSAQPRSRPPTAKVQTALGGSRGGVLRLYGHAGTQEAGPLLHELFYKYIIVLQNPFVRGIRGGLLRRSPPRELQTCYSFSTPGSDPDWSLGETVASPANP